MATHDVYAKTFIDVCIISLFVLYVCSRPQKGRVWSRFEWLIGISLVVLTERKLSPFRQAQRSINCVLQVTLQLRLYAMYDKSRWMFIVLAVSFAATFGTVFALVFRIVVVEGGMFRSYFRIYADFTVYMT